MARKRKNAVLAQKPMDPEAQARVRLTAELPSYLSHLTRQRLLTAEEEIALALRAKQGDSAARTRLIEANMRLVLSIARNYHTSLVPFEDLVQEGAIGLMTACERYDPARGFRFSTYATHWVRQAISRAIDNKARAIRVPAHVAEILRRIERARAQILRENGEEPTLEQLAARVGVSPRKIVAYLQTGQDPVSLDMLVGEDANTSLASLLNDKTATDPEDAVIRHEVEEELQTVLESLSERERMVMRRRLGLEDEEAHVLQDIGREMRLSRERVRQIENQARRKLQAIALRRRLREFLSE
jgi:RNA polymerase primary sigma factor